jgi:hypothetical protein
LEISFIFIVFCILEFRPYAEESGSVKHNRFFLGRGDSLSVAANRCRDRTGGACSGLISSLLELLELLPLSAPAHLLTNLSIFCLGTRFFN